jgi:hypothetical protein
VDRPTVAQFFLETWIPAIQRTIRISTASGYRGHVRNHIVPLLGDTRLDELDGPTLNSFTERSSLPRPRDLVWLPPRCAECTRPCIALFATQFAGVFSS